MIGVVWLKLITGSKSCSLSRDELLIFGIFSDDILCLYLKSKSSFTFFIRESFPTSFFIMIGFEMFSSAI